MLEEFENFRASLALNRAEEDASQHSVVNLDVIGVVCQCHISLRVFLKTLASLKEHEVVFEGAGLDVIASSQPILQSRAHIHGVLFMDADSDDHIDEVAGHLARELLFGEVVALFFDVLDDLFEVFLFGVHCDRFEERLVYGGVKCDASEEISFEEVFCTSALLFGSHGTGEHLEKDEFDVGDEVVHLVGTVDDGEGQFSDFFLAHSLYVLFEGFLRHGEGALVSEPAEKVTVVLGFSFADVFERSHSLLVFDGGFFDEHFVFWYFFFLGFFVNCVHLFQEIEEGTLWLGGDSSTLHLSGVESDRGHHILHRLRKWWLHLPKLGRLPFDAHIQHHVSQAVALFQGVLRFFVGVQVHDRTRVLGLAVHLQVALFE